MEKKPNKVSLRQHRAGEDGNSINSVIPKKIRKTAYPSFERLIDIAFHAGKNGYLWCIDMKDSYFTLPIRKEYIPLFGAEWHGKIFFYACLPFGLATAPRIFNMFADCLQYIVELEHETDKLKMFDHYLDVFFAGHPNKSIATKQFNGLDNLLKKVNIPTSERKKVAPTHKITLLGYQLDTTTQ